MGKSEKNPKRSQPNAKKIEKKIERDEIIRRGRLKAVRDYAGLLAQLLVGGGCTAAGFFEALSPETIPAEIDPALAMGSGLLILGGKRALKIAKKFFNAVDDDGGVVDRE